MWQVINTMSLKPDNHYKLLFSFFTEREVTDPYQTSVLMLREHQSPLEGLLVNRLLCSALAGSDSGRCTRA